MTLQRVPWHELEPEFISTWGRPNGKFGAEHVSIVGPTGSGKSNFQTYVMNKRCELRGSYAIIIATKRADSTLKSTHWPIVRKYPPEWKDREQYILWPESTRNAEESLYIQRSTIRQCLTDIWVENSNTIVAFDEIAYVEQELRLKTIINRYWREGRSIGITVVATTQRPRNVTRYMWSEPTWIVAFKPDDEDESKRVAEIIGGRKLYTDSLLSLKEYEFILIKRRTKEAYISKLPH